MIWLRPIRSVIILVINISDSRCALFWFCHHSYDYRPNGTPLSLIIITNNDNNNNYNDNINNNNDDISYNNSDLVLNLSDSFCITKWGRTRDQPLLKPDVFWRFFLLIIFLFVFWMKMILFPMTHKDGKVSLESSFLLVFLFFLSTIARVENTIKYHQQQWYDPYSSKIFGSCSWFAFTMDAMFPRLLSWLGSKYFSQPLWWKTAHYYCNKEKFFRVWRIHRYCLGWEHINIRQSWERLRASFRLIFKGIILLNARQVHKLFLQPKTFH